MDSGAEGRVVVKGHVKRNLQLPRELRNKFRARDPGFSRRMQMDLCNPEHPEHIDQQVIVVFDERIKTAQILEGLRSGRRREPHPSGVLTKSHPQHPDGDPILVQRPGERLDVSFDAAIPIVVDEEDRWLLILTEARRCAQARRIDPHTCKAQRITADERFDARFKIRVARAQSARGLRSEPNAAASEGEPSLVANQHVRRHDISPTRLLDPQAEIRLLSITRRESRIEAPHRLETIAPDVQAETHASRNIDDPPRIDATGPRIELGEIHFERGGLLRLHERIAGQISVIRKRRHGADPGRTANRRPQSVEPVSEDEDVTIQQHHVRRGIKGQPALNRRQVASIDSILKEGEMAVRREGLEGAAKTTLGRRVLDNDEPHLRGGLAHGMEAGQGDGFVPVRGHDDVGGP